MVVVTSSSLNPPLCLIFLLLIPGALGKGWSVTYKQQEICAIKGARVLITGTYTVPTDHTVQKTCWVIDPVKERESPPLGSMSDYSDRVEYSYKEGKMFLNLSNVRKTDEHQYCFRIITNKDKWLGHPGVTLKVTDLQVLAPPEVTEGKEVILACTTTCNLTDQTFLWYKNGHELQTKIVNNNELHFQTVSSEDVGNYSCAVKEYEHLSSPGQTLSIRYPPKNVSVSISPSADAVEGKSVTLTCSSDANPPVKDYTWFKEGGNSSVGSGQTYEAVQSGFYYCESQNELGSRRSDSVSVTVQESLSVFAVAGVVAVCVGVCLIAAFLCVWNKKRRVPAVNQSLSQNNIQPTNISASNPSADQDDVQYASINWSTISARKSESSAGRTSATGHEDVQYASVQFHSNKVKKK